MVLLGFLFVLIVSHLFLLQKSFNMQDSALFFTLNFMQVLSLIGFNGMLIPIFFYPGILYGCHCWFHENTRLVAPQKR
jgi:hypothetical protein